MTLETLTAALDEATSRWASRCALVWAGRSMTYGEFGARARALARAYRRLGVGPGDCVVTQLPNRPEHLLAAAAAWQCGAVHVGVDPDLTLPELTWRVARTAPPVVVLRPEALGGTAAIDSLHADHPSLRVIAVDGAAAKAPCFSFDRLLAEPDRAGEGADEHWQAAPGAPAVVFFTSGTTSVPKGVVRYHRNVLESWLAMGEVFAVGPDDVHLVQLPLSHGFGFGMALMGLLTGGKLALVERFSAGECLRLIARERVTILHGTPAHFALLLDRLDPDGHDASTVRAGMGSGAAFPVPLLRRIFDRLDMRFLLCYGSSEGLGWATSDWDDILRGSVGRPPPDVVQVVQVDGARQPVPAGEIGEIACRRDHPFRHWGEPAADGPPSPGWYYTGDLGRVDEEGRLYVLGRVRHQVNRGGIGIDPSEIESALAGHPSLTDVAVVGLPDAVLGEVVCACVVPADGTAPPTLDQLRDFLAPSLARHKLPEELCVLEELPRTSRMKVHRDALRAVAAAQPGRERHRPPPSAQRTQPAAG